MATHYPSTSEQSRLFIAFNFKMVQNKPFVKKILIVVSNLADMAIPMFLLNSKYSIQETKRQFTNKTEGTLYTSPHIHIHTRALHTVISRV